MTQKRMERSWYRTTIIAFYFILGLAIAAVAVIIAAWVEALL